MSLEGGGGEINGGEGFDRRGDWNMRVGERQRCYIGGDGLLREAGTHSFLRRGKTLAEG